MFHVKHSIIHNDVSDESLVELDSLINNHSGKLQEYASQLMWWNKRVNLVSRDVSRETIMEHIRHSLLISTTEAFKSADNIIDTGTGGGLPGLPLAICCEEKEFILNDIVTKKIMAVKQMGMKLKLQNIQTVATSIENIDMSPGVLVISKHAFKGDDLVNYLKGKDWRSIVLLKGAAEAEEELRKVEGLLDIKITNLDNKMDRSFYKGKALVEISRRKK